MRHVIAAIVVVSCLGTAARAQQLTVPAGYHAAAGATASSFKNFADKIIHEKTGMEMILVSAGSFAMGPAKKVQVTIGEPFYIGKTEVTNAQFRRFVEATGYDGKGDIDPDPDYDLYLRHWRGKSIMSDKDDYPVVWVSWKNAKAFCRWAGLNLPSEAQWEYACRAGTTTPYYFGEDRKAFDQYGWAITSTEYHTHPVTGKPANPWGLYDMLGNVWEWAEDDYANKDYFEHKYIDSRGGPPADGSARIADGMTKVLKGGSWGTSAVVCRSDSRYNTAPINASAEIGFRVILPLKGISPSQKITPGDE